MLSPIQIKRHYINSVEFDTIKECVDKGEEEIQFSLRSRKVDNHWHVILGVRFGPKEEVSVTHFKGKVEAEGVFKVSEDFPEEKVSDLVNMNGGAILYGAIREIVMTLSSRSRYGPLELPTIDARIFIEIAKKAIPKNKDTKEDEIRT
jgi:preprotein translocase subunit SecB